MVVPAEIAVSRPVDALMAATAGLLLLHVPPLVMSISVVVVPMHWSVVPITAATDGAGLMVTVMPAAALQPDVPVTV